MLSISLILSSYFVASYLMSRNTFQHLSESLNDLQVFYERQNCLPKLFVNYRQEIMMKVKSEDMLSPGILEECRELENKFSEIKRSNPSYLSRVETYINELES